MSKLLAIVAFWCVVLCDLTLAHASGNVAVSWRQDADCEFVHHWELQVGGVPTADLTGTCGGVMMSTLLVTGVGPKAFRMRAVTAEGWTSGWSNEVTATLPFAAPGLVEVKIE